MQFSVQICVFLWSLSFAQRDEEKRKKIRTKQEQKTISFVTHVAWSKSESQFWMSKSKHLKCNNWNWEFKNVSRTLNFSSSVCEKVLRYTLNLQMLIWKNLLRGQEGVPILLTSYSQIKTQHSSVSESSYLKLNAVTNTTGKHLNISRWWMTH